MTVHQSGLGVCFGDLVVTLGHFLTHTPSLPGTVCCRKAKTGRLLQSMLPEIVTQFHIFLRAYNVVTGTFFICMQTLLSPKYQGPSERSSRVLQVLRGWFHSFCQEQM